MRKNFSDEALHTRDHPAGIEYTVRVEAFFQAAVQGGDGRLQGMEAAACGWGSFPT